MPTVVEFVYVLRGLSRLVQFDIGGLGYFDRSIEGFWRSFRVALLIAPLYNVHSEMGMLFGIKAFAVAILGGITSAPGIMAAGIIYGVGEALVTALFGSTYTQIVMFAIVIGALAAMPNGLFGRAPVKKV